MAQEKCIYFKAKEGNGVAIIGKEDIINSIEKYFLIKIILNQLIKIYLINVQHR